MDDGTQVGGDRVQRRFRLPRRCALRSTDLAGSQDFYERQVGLALAPETIKNHLLFACGDEAMLLIYGRPAPNKAEQGGTHPGAVLDK